MNILTLFVVIPVLTVAGILFTKDLKQSRLVSAIGMTAQLILSAILVYLYVTERQAGNMAPMLFTFDALWFPALNIHYAVGVDGISVAMIALTCVVVFAGIFASWKMEFLSREFFISLILLATGVFGFFISLDLFTMFLFYEIAVIPMYLLIGIWGSGPKEYSAMKLTLMLMGGSALLMVGILGIYFYSVPTGGQLTFNVLEIAKHKIPIEMQRFLFPFTFVGFGILGALFPFHTWSPDGHASAPTAVSMLHAGVLMKLGGYGAFRVAIFLMPEIIQRYCDFVTLIRTKYPKAAIFCVLGNMDATQAESPWPGYIEKAIQKLSIEKNDHNIYSLMFPYKNTPSHPTISEHKQM